MWQLFQYPLCPFSRKVRLLLGEMGLEYELRREIPWSKSEALKRMNCVGQTPVLADPQDGTVLADSRAICEYIDETLGPSPLMAGNPFHRAEIRRLIAWFDESFYAEVTAPLLFERLVKRFPPISSPTAGRLGRLCAKRTIGSSR